MTTRQHIRKVRLQERTAPRRGPQAVSRAAHDDYWYQPRVNGQTTAGVAVTEETSMTYATVWACVNKLSKTVATLPLHVKEHTGPTTTRTATEQPLDTLLRVKPNPEQTAVQFREAIMANVLLWGNAFVYLRSAPSGGVQDMWLLLSRYMKVDRDRQGNLVYDYEYPGKELEQYNAEEILHIGGLGFDGTMGLSVIGYHRQTVGVGMGATAHVNAFLDNGAQPGIVIQRPVDAPPLSPEAEQRVLDSFEDRHGGSTKAWRTALLREGMTLATVGMPLKDMEFVSLRRFQKGDIAGIFDVPLTKIHENERDTFSNVEQKNIEWSTDSILPWCVRIENAFDAKFFENSPYFIKHTLAGIARGDMETRYAAYAIGIQWGFLLRDEVRELEDMNPIEGGDKPLVPMNMIPADQVGEVPEPTPAATPPDAVALQKYAQAGIAGSEAGRKFHAIHESFRRLATEAAQRCVTKEVKAVGNAWNKHARAGTVDDFTKWVDKFYQGHMGYVLAAMRPVVDEWSAAAGVAVASLEDACNVCGTIRSLMEVVATNPTAVPQFLEDLSETFAASLVADIESRLTKGTKPCATE